MSCHYRMRHGTYCNAFRIWWRKIGCFRHAAPKATRQLQDFRRPSGRWIAKWASRIEPNVVQVDPCGIRNDNRRHMALARARRCRPRDLTSSKSARSSGTAPFVSIDESPLSNSPLSSIQRVQNSARSFSKFSGEVEGLAVICFATIWVSNFSAARRR